MYANAASVSRPEISAFLEEAQGIEKLLIGTKVLPVYTSTARAGRYPKLRIQLGELLKTGGDKRAPDGTYSEVSRSWEWDTFDCQEWGLTERIDDALREEMKNFFDLEVTTSKAVMRQLMLAHELRVSTLVMSSGNSGFTATNPTADYTEANLATINFAKDVTDALARLEAKGVVPNTLVLSRDLFNRVRRTTKLQSWVFGNALVNSGNADITEKMLGDRFGISQVLVCGAKYDSAIKGQAPVLTNLWANTTILLADVKGGDFNAGGFGRAITWGADVPGGLFATESYRVEERRGDIIRVRMNNANKIIDPTAGELITTNYA
jgi:hypothetical protein